MASPPPYIVIEHFNIFPLPQFRFRLFAVYFLFLGNPFVLPGLTSIYIKFYCHRNLPILRYAVGSLAIFRLLFSL